MKSKINLIFQLNATDECSNIEAKKTSEIRRSLLKTICAFSNEANLTSNNIRFISILSTNLNVLHTNLSAIPTNLDRIKAIKNIKTNSHEQ